jgi:PTH1 family peptidyl-tRNA hydrolase
MHILVGLGNPGAEYATTRHNAGFMAVDHLARRFGVRIHRLEGQALTGRGAFAGREFLLAKPQTFMNLSGEPLNPLGIHADDLIVIHDDMDIPLGQVRVKTGGGTGGHKGLNSIKAALGTGDFIRVRFGIGRPPAEWDPSDYVLGKFAKEDHDIVQEQIVAACEAVELCLKGEVTKAMNAFNRRPAKQSEEE